MAPQQVIVMLGFVVAALWINPSWANYYSNYDPYYQAPVYYHYQWEVKDEPSGNDYHQEEKRDGELTTGLYQVLLPDGRHQRVNYRVNKDSGFVADVSYQGEANYYHYQRGKDQSNYPKPSMSWSPAPSYYESPSYPMPVDKPSYPTYSSYAVASPAPVDKPSYSTYPSYAVASPAPADKASYPPSYPSYPAAYSSYPKANEYPSYYEAKPQQPYYPVYPAPKYYSPPAKTYTPTTTTTTTTTPAPEPVTEEPKYEDYISSDYSIPSYPLYRIDYYAARAKSGKGIPDTPGYAIDSSGSTYIKPAAAYSVPDKLGTYEINHRKATMRKPSRSDYQAPESLQWAN